jgi:hypothetical protein
LVARNVLAVFPRGGMTGRCSENVLGRDPEQTVR